MRKKHLVNEGDISKAASLRLLDEFRVAALLHTQEIDVEHRGVFFVVRVLLAIPRTKNIFHRCFPWQVRGPLSRDGLIQ